MIYTKIFDRCKGYMYFVFHGIIVIFRLDPSYQSVVCVTQLKVIYYPLYGMNNFVTTKSKLPQDGAQVFPYMVWLAIMWPSERVTW